MDDRQAAQLAAQVESDPSTLRAALDYVPIGVAIVSVPDFVFEYVNPAFQRFAPGTPMIGRPNLEVFPEVSSLAGEVLKALALTGEPVRHENMRNLIRRRPDGPLEEIYGTFEVYRLESEGRLHLVVTAVETTEQVRLEAVNERLRESEGRRLELAETLDDVNRAIHSSLDYDEVMQRSLEEAANVLGARAGAVFIGQDNESEARYIYGFPRSLLGRRFPADIFPFSRMLETSKEPISIPEPEMGRLMNKTLARLFGVRSMLAIPVVIRARLGGGIGLIWGEPHDFTAPEIDFARGFGASVSLALENAELYQQQERVADTLQSAMLTLPKRIPGLDFAHLYRSASETVKVGGDFYDLFELERGVVGMTVGDISGKGLDAAALTSLVKNSVHAQATEAGRSVTDVLRVVNSVLFQSSAPEEFATLFFGMLDCRDGRLAYCNAGHTAAALVRRHEIEQLPGNSSFVGAYAQAEFRQSETTVDRGDVLFLYTDGLIEARNGGVQYGERRLFDLLASTAGASPHEMCDKVDRDLAEFTHGQLEDDMAILAVKRL